MSISLDGNTYSVRGTGYGHPQRKISDTKRTLTGALSRVESGVFDNIYDLTLIVTTAQIATLRTSYAKVTTTGTPAANLLDFTDEEGVHWNPASSGGGNVNTGVWFDGTIDPKPMTERGWTSGNRFLVQIRLLVNAQGLSS
jgi:hypothetical protein